jgi:DNA-binding LacI/PurR family transcriptional regulator
MSGSNGPARAKYREIADRLWEEITSTGYRDGETIPTIRVLADRYGVNPQTVNKATAYLVSKGCLQSRQGSGIVVRMPDRGTVTLRAAMLVDAERAKLLDAGETAVNYHCKDIYLSYLSIAQAQRLQTSFVVYDDGPLSGEMREELRQADGFIVQGSLPPSYLEALRRSRTPTVFVNRDLPPADGGVFGTILVSTAHVRDMCNYLLTMGHRKILYVLYALFDRGEVFQHRRAIVDRALLEWRSSQRGGEQPVVTEFVFDPGDPAADERLSALVDTGYTAAFGYNDFSALELYRVIRRTGLDVPEDMSVVGFDGLMVGEYATPPLTTVRVNRAKLVQEAFALLSDLIEGSAPETARVRIIDTEIVLRSSVSPPTRRT